MNKTVIFQGNLKHKSWQKDLCQLRWALSGPWNLHISFNISSTQLPTSFGVSFDYLCWSILLEMQELLLARVKHSCPETLSLSRNPLKAAIITLLQFKCKTSRFIINHVWLRPELVASLWIPLLSNQPMCLAINCLVLIQKCLEWMYITVQRLNPLKVNTMEKEMAKLLKLLLWKNETHWNPKENDRCHSDLQIWTQCSPHTLSLKPSFPYLL